MKFEKIDDDLENKFYDRYQIKLPDGRDFEVLLWNVIHGVRVIGKYSDDYIGYSFHWCCGADLLTIVATHRLVRMLIENGMPISEFVYGPDIKPWPKDPDFTKWLDDVTDKYFIGGVSSPADKEHP
jgi:hypothetical protein